MLTYVNARLSHLERYRIERILGFADAHLSDAYRQNGGRLLSTALRALCGADTGTHERARECGAGLMALREYLLERVDPAWWRQFFPDGYYPDPDVIAGQLAENTVAQLRDVDDVLPLVLEMYTATTLNHSPDLDDMDDEWDAVANDAWPTPPVKDEV